LKLTGGFEDTALKPLEDEEDELGDFVSDGQQSDPRRIIDAIERHYKAANPGLAVPWSNLAFVRLKKLLASFTNWGPDEWIRCVGNRFASDGIIPGEPPESFIQHLSKYISGPLNQYGRQKGQSDENVSARTRRNRAALNAALDELDRSYEAARKRDAEVWLGQGDSLEVYWDADSGFRN
jgi:hypothetical protein